MKPQSRLPRRDAAHRYYCPDCDDHFPFRGDCGLHQVEMLDTWNPQPPRRVRHVVLLLVLVLVAYGELLRDLAGIAVALVTSR
jgi:hypothetical protein